MPRGESRFVRLESRLPCERLSFQRGTSFGGRLCLWECRILLTLERGVFHSERRARLSLLSSSGSVWCRCPHRVRGEAGEHERAAGAPQRVNEQLREL